jgi:large subunit ribosomal protein L4
MKLDIHNIEGKPTGKKLDLPASVFGVEPNEHVMYLDVKQYLANQRQGTHKAKERGEIRGSTRKIKRQKGTGTARAGSMKNPLFRSGGRVFGPRPRNYGFKLNKKVKSLARISALSHKAKDNAIMLVEDFTFDQPSTSQLFGILKNLNCSDVRTVLVLGDNDSALHLSGRNLPKSSVIRASDLNTYSILNNKRLLISESGLNTLSEMLA